jgi:type VI secretion system protein ImpA
MSVDIETLLAPFPGGNPAGENLEYDDGRGELQQAFERPESVDSQGQRSAAADVDWKKIVTLIERQCARTKDIWLGVYLCRAGANISDIQTVERGAELLAGLCERYWDTMYPLLDEDGFLGRSTPCESLVNIPRFLTPLRRVSLLRHPRHGAFSGEDFERVRSEGDSAEGGIALRMALDETPDEALNDIAERLDRIASAFKRVDDVLTAKQEGDDTPPDFRPTFDALNQIKRAVLSFSKAPPAAETVADEPLPNDGSPPAAPVVRATGRVDSREDVVRTLDLIIEYYRRQEPTSPVPLLLQRAREWVNLDFMGVLEDIAPAGLGEARSILNSRAHQ